MAQKSVLGKGLASLLPSAPVSMPEMNPTPNGSAPVGDKPGVTTAAMPVSDDTMLNRDRHPGISLANVAEIQENPYQPRKDFDSAAIEELSQSIRENGIIQPLVVRKTPRGYELIAGERRLRAARMAGLKFVPIVIRRSTDKESLELALIENIQRKDLNCIDEALAYQQLMTDFSLTQEDVSKKVAKDRATIANALRLLRLPEAIRQSLRSGELSFGHGKALLSLENPEKIESLWKEILENKLSVRAAESRAQEINAAASVSVAEEQPAPAPAETPLALRMKTLSVDLTNKWSGLGATKVEMRGTEKRGKFILTYRNREDLERLIAALMSVEPKA